MAETARRERNGTLKRFFANTGWLVAQNVFQYVLSAVVGILAARYIGPTNYGLLNYGATLMALFLPFCTLGLNSAEIPAMVDEPEKAGEIVGTCFVLRLVSSTLSIALLTAVAAAMKRGNRLLILVTFLQSLQFLFQSCDAIRLWFQKELLSRYTAIGSVIGNLVCSAWRILLLVRGASVEWFALTSVIQMMTNYLFVVPVFFTKSGLRLRFSLSTAGSLLRRGYHFILSGLTVAVTNYAGRLILGNLLGETELGYYSAASSVALMWIFVPQAIISSATPVLLRVKKEEPAAFGPRYQTLHLANLLLGLCARAGMSLLAGWIIRFLYSDAYLPAVPLLRVLAWSGVFTAIGESRGIWLFAEDRVRFVKHYCTVSAVCSLALNSVLIRLMGAMGAAVSALLTGAVQSLGAPLLFRETRAFTAQWLGCWRQARSVVRFIRTRGRMEERNG